MGSYVRIIYGDYNILFGPFTLNQLDAFSLFRLSGLDEEIRIIPSVFMGCLFEVIEINSDIEYKNMRPRKAEDSRGTSYFIGVKGDSVCNTYDVLHRNGGPALISKTTGKCYWYVKRERYSTTREYCKALKYTKIKTMAMMLKYGEILPTHIDMC